MISHFSLLACLNLFKILLQSRAHNTLLLNCVSSINFATLDRRLPSRSFAFIMKSVDPSTDLLRHTTSYVKSI